MFVTSNFLSGFGATGSQSTTTYAINYQRRQILDANGKQVNITFETPAGSQITQDVIMEATKKQFPELYAKDTPQWLTIVAHNYKSDQILNDNGTPVQFKLLTNSSSPTMEEVKTASKLMFPKLYDLDKVSARAYTHQGAAITRNGSDLLTVTFMWPPGVPISISVSQEVTKQKYPDYYAVNNTDGGGVVFVPTKYSIRAVNDWGQELLDTKGGYLTVIWWSMTTPTVEDQKAATRIAYKEQYNGPAQTQLPPQATRKSNSVTDALKGTSSVPTPTTTITAPGTLSPTGASLPQVSTPQSQEVVATTAGTSIEKTKVNPVWVGVGILGVVWLLGRGSGKRSIRARVGVGV